MSAIDTSFERVFETLRAERAELSAEMRAVRLELKAEMGALNQRLNQLDDRLNRIGFRAAGILATGLIALVAAQLWG